MQRFEVSVIKITDERRIQSGEMKYLKSVRIYPLTGIKVMVLTEIHTDTYAI
jgi:hypothetical protein